MRAIIVAAGRGSRMGDLTVDKPKCFLEFHGKKLIEWQVSALHKNDINDISLVRGYKGECFDTLPFELNLYDNSEWSSTNMVYSLMCADKVLSSGDDILISYGDIIYEPGIIKTILSTEGDIVISVDNNWLDLWSIRNEDPLSDAESLTLTDDFRVLDIGKKVDDITKIQAQYMGLILLRSNGTKIFKTFYDNTNATSPWLMGRTLDNCYMTDILQGLINSGTDIIAAPINGGWLEFDTNDDLNIYNKLTKNSELDKFIKL